MTNIVETECETSEEEKEFIQLKLFEIFSKYFNKEENILIKSNKEKINT